MKVIITPPKSVRKEYTNLPERDPNRDRLRARKKAEQDRSTEAAALANSASSVTFAPAADTSKAESSSVPHNDPIESLLSDNELTEPSFEHVEEQSWRNSRWVPIILIAAIIALGGAWYFATHFERGLKLDRITVAGNQLLRDREIIQLAGIDRDQKFYDIDLRKIEANLLRHSLIKSAHPHREVNPATIVLDIEERQPVAMVRSESTGEAYIINRDGVILRPKLISGLKDPVRIMQVPILSGVSDKDSASLRYMSRLVSLIESIDSNALQTAIGELHRTPTGAYVLYTVETQTPIFIGAPTDASIPTALEEEARSEEDTPQTKPAATETLFVRQIKLLASIWHKKLEQDLRSNSALYVDARFNGEVIVRQKRGAGAAKQPVASVASKLLSSVITSQSAPMQQ